MAECPLPPDHEMFAAEQELLRGLATLPRLSPGLRGRVLQASLQARCHSQFWNRVQVTAAAVLFCIVSTGIGSYYASLWQADNCTIVAHQEQHDDSPVLSIAQMSLSTALIEAPGNDWELVEASLSAREQSFHLLLAAFWE